MWEGLGGRKVIVVGLVAGANIPAARKMVQHTVIVYYKTYI